MGRGHDVDIIMIVKEELNKKEKSELEAELALL